MRIVIVTFSLGSARSPGFSAKFPLPSPPFFLLNQSLKLSFPGRNLFGSEASGYTSGGGLSAAGASSEEDFGVCKRGGQRATVFLPSPPFLPSPRVASHKAPIVTASAAPAAKSVNPSSAKRLSVTAAPSCINSPAQPGQQKGGRWGGISIEAARNGNNSFGAGARARASLLAPG